MHRRALFAFLPALLLAVVAIGQDAPKKPRLAFVTNCVAEFWTVGSFGVEAAKSEFGVDAVVRMPANGTAEEQKRILEDLLAKGVQGIAVSPKDPENMTALLDKVAGRALLVTHDSDAPKSKRLCYVGMDNYDAGRICGQLVKDALPDGGAVVLFVGNLDQDNARRRRQGVVDELLDRSRDPSRFDKQDAVLKAGKYEIRATFTDQFDRQKGKAAASTSRRCCSKPSSRRTAWARSRSSASTRTTPRCRASSTATCTARWCRTRTSTAASRSSCWPSCCARPMRRSARRCCRRTASSTSRRARSPRPTSRSSGPT